MKSKRDFPIATEEDLLSSSKKICSQLKEYNKTNIYSMMDSVSLLESLRGYQLSQILGKYKLF